MNIRVLRNRLAERAGRDQCLLRYLQPVLYPCLEVTVQLLEKSRDQMADLERAVLGMCGVGVGMPEEVAFALGLKPHRLAPLLREIEGRGLVARAAPDTPYYVTDLGRLSYQQGAELLRSTRALLLCGITGRLLPASAYDSPPLAASELGKRHRDTETMLEASAIPLQHLRLEAIPNKAAVNLPDEVIEIEGVLPGSARPCFLDALLEIVTESDGQTRCRCYFNDLRGYAGWLSVEQAVGLLEPLGYPRQSPDQVLELLAQDLERWGGRGVRARLDAHGNPELELQDVEPEFYAFRVAEQPLFFSVGAGALLPVPCVRYELRPPVGGGHDVLRGRTLRVLAAENSQLAANLYILRLLRQTQIEARKVRANDSERARMLLALLAQHGIDVAVARALVKLTGRHELLDGLPAEG